MDILRDAALRVLLEMHKETLTAIHDAANDLSVSRMDPSRYHLWLLRQEERVAVLEALIVEKRKLPGNTVVAKTEWTGE